MLNYKFIQSFYVFYNTFFKTNSYLCAVRILEQYLKKRHTPLSFLSVYGYLDCL